MHRVLIISLTAALLAVCMIAGAEDSEKFILCNPRQDNHVAIRRSPRKGAEESGRLECGDMIRTDGKVRNGYLHIYGVTEDGEGWVHLGYVVDDAPIIENCNATVEATGRVMARRNIGGKRKAWLKVCDQLRVFARSEEWAVTNKGYIRVKYLDIWY